MFAVRRMVLSSLWIFTQMCDKHVSKGTIFDLESSIENYHPKYNIYHNLSKLNDCIHDFTVLYPNFIDVQMKFRSRWGLSQYVIHVTNFTRIEKNSVVDNRTRILFSYGEHSSEFLPVESMLLLLENITSGTQLDSRTSAQAFSEFVLNNVDLYIVAMLNPDGRFIVEKTKNYCWRFTSTKMDLNSINNVGALREEAIFQQTEPNRVTSEPECKVIAELLTEKQIDVVISFHSQGKFIIIPEYSEAQSHVQKTKTMHILRPSIKDHIYLASLLSSETALQYPYTLVNVSSVNKESILSYVSKTRKIPFSFIISLWGNDEQQGCFTASNPQSEQLQEALQAIQPLYAALFKYIVKWKHMQVLLELENSKTVVHSAEERGWHILSFRTLVVIVILYLIIYFIPKHRLPFAWRLLFRRPRRIVSLRSLATAFSLVFLIM